MATTLSFFGFSWEVINFMQRASHGTRAYIINAGMLKGFLKDSYITHTLSLEMKINPKKLQFLAEKDTAHEVFNVIKKISEMPKKSRYDWMFFKEPGPLYWSLNRESMGVDQWKKKRKYLYEIASLSDYD